MPVVRGAPIQKNDFFFLFARDSPDDQTLAKEPEDSGYEIDLNEE